LKKISRKNKEFKIVPENKMVICEMNKKNIFDETFGGIPDDIEDIIEFALRILYYNDWIDWGLDKFGTITAKATCDEHDEYDEEKGMAVAASKAIKKQHLQLARKYDRAHMILMEAANVVRDKCMDHMKKVQAIDDDLVNYYGRARE